MSQSPANVQRTLTYAQNGFYKATLWVALVGFVLGFVGVHTLYHGSAKYTQAWLIVVVCGAWGGYAFFKLFNPGKPVLELSPNGILYRMPGVKEISIPWNEVRNVDTVSARIRLVRLPPFGRAKAWDLTAIMVSRSFYESSILVEEAYLRGTWWSNTFEPKGEMVRMVLSH